VAEYPLTPYENGEFLWQLWIQLEILYYKMHFFNI
jgi:hypothetical protein